MWEIVVSVVGYLSKALRTSRERPEALFRDYVIPLHEDLLQIHNDYTGSFSDLSGMIADESIAREEIVAFVERHRKKLNPVRVGSGEFAKALTELFTFRFQKKRMPEDSVEQLLFQYADAVISYLYGTFDLPEPDTSACDDDVASEIDAITGTRYSSFVKIANASRREACEREELARVVTKVEDELEHSWILLAERYSVLKARCLM